MPLADSQPQDDVRVCLDPAGHPCCLFLGWARPGAYPTKWHVWRLFRSIRPHYAPSYGVAR